MQFDPNKITDKSHLEASLILIHYWVKVMVVGKTEKCWVMVMAASKTKDNFAKCFKNTKMKVLMNLRMVIMNILDSQTFATSI